jgi:2-polyprenyl-3-methyl-5-hydroxy-6-metoxy-1,4-benzoquinol methylase
MALFKELKRLWPDFRRMASRFVLLVRQPDTLNQHGVKLALGSWATPSIRRLIYQGWYEENERAILELTLRSDDTVLELGCGAGYITTVAAGRAREVRAFDANPEMV